MKIYLVGGAVRDQLLGRPVKDKDWVVVGASLEKMQSLGYQQVGQDFPVFLHPDTHEEYALARTERKSGHGYGGFQFEFDGSVTLEEDLLRRDLTINAMAMDDDGNIIDPYRGQQDLNDRILRHVSPAFEEDPLRVLRVARFAARYKHLGFTVASETMALMQSICHSGEIEHLTAERVWQETQRALTEPNPETYFQVLKDCDGLQYWFKEVDRLFGVPQPEKYHPEVDTGIHTLMVLEQACLLSQEPMMRFAALVHDLGKGVTDPSLWPKHHGHEKKGVKEVDQLCDRLKTPNNYRKLGKQVSEYHTHVHRAFELKPETIHKTLMAVNSLKQPDTFDWFLMACKADSRGRPGFETVEYAQAAYFKEANEVIKTVTAKEVMQDGLTGPAISQEIRNRQIIKLAEFKKNSDHYDQYRLDTH